MCFGKCAGLTGALVCPRDPLSYRDDMGMTVFHESLTFRSQPYRVIGPFGDPPEIGVRRTLWGGSSVLDPDSRCGSSNMPLPYHFALAD